MAATQKSLTTLSESNTPYQINSAQVLKATTALSKHLATTIKSESSDKKDVLALDDDETPEGADQPPVFLLLTAKRHIVDKARLKPGKIRLPHTLDTPSNAKICIITADPPSSNPKAYKELIQGPTFPPALSSRIAKVIPFSRLKAKYKSYESIRQFFAEYDLFLADDRIVTLLPQVLGKVFYKGTQKRPVPIVLSAKKDGVKKEPMIGGARKRKIGEEGGSDSIGTTAEIAREIENALTSTHVHLSQSAQTSVRIARADWPADHIAANVEAVANELIDRFVPQKWRNVKSIYIKGHQSAALPIWLAEEIFIDEEDIAANGIKSSTPQKKLRKGVKEETKAIEDGAVKPIKTEKKRKVEAAEEQSGFTQVAEDKSAKKIKKEQDAKDLKVERKASSASRKDKLKQLKAQAVA